MIEWIVEATYEERFPYRLWIVEDDAVLLCLRTQERWPGPRGQIFCLRDDPDVLAESAVKQHRTRGRRERLPVGDYARFPPLATPGAASPPTSSARRSSRARAGSA